MQLVIFLLLTVKCKRNEKLRRISKKEVALALENSKPVQTAHWGEEDGSVLGNLLVKRVCVWSLDAVSHPAQNTSTSD